jgi:SAM-dependent methyltransferase
MRAVEAMSTTDAVRDFWERNPCGHETSEAADRLTYFLEIERRRYESAPWIRDAACFARFRGQCVLEIGCGMGTDGAQFAQAGAEYVGVDLTESAVVLARENFARRGLEGEFLAVDAERLPFPAGSFDHVYSFGVIHHTPRPQAIVQEIDRVLRPGGTVTAMVYNRSSINYYAEIMVLRKLARALLRPAWVPGILARLLGLPEAKLEGHRINLLRLPHPTLEQWVSMNTDGPECPLARVYSAPEAKALFGGFEGVGTDVYMFDRSHWPFVGRLVSDRLASAIGRRAGWNRMVYARKGER